MIPLQRYSALLKRHLELSDPDRSVLEIGGGSPGIGGYLNRPVIGVDRAFTGPRDVRLTPVVGSALQLPFADHVFDDVVCMDALAHLPGADRHAALRELIRVARQRVMLVGPAGFFAAAAESAYAAHIANTAGKVPAGLAERVRYGIPMLGDLVEALWATGYAFTVEVNEGILQHYAGLFIQSHPFMTRFVQGHEAKFPGESPLAAAPGDVPYSYQFTIDVSMPRTTLASASPGRADHDRARPVGRPPGSLRLFAVAHRSDRMLEVPGLQSLFVGAGEPNRDALRDNVGDSIADRNARYSEMTGIYWVWKNVKDADAVGFCHYRRYFDFRPNVVRPERQTELRSPQEVARNVAYFADRAVIDRHLAAGAIIIARLEPLPIGSGEQYMWAHVASHYLTLVNYVLAAHPHLAPQLIAQLRETRLVSNNMFIMSWHQFDRLCEFWFDCLFAIEQQLETMSSAYQQRTLAFLSERVFDLHVRWLAHSGQPVIEYPIFFLADAAFSNTGSPSMKAD